MNTSRSGYCPICRRWYKDYHSHQCPREFRVWEECGSEEDAVTLRADDAADAAWEWAEKVANDDPSYNDRLCGGGTHVIVADADGKRRRVHVYGEPTVDYFTQYDDLEEGDDDAR